MVFASELNPERGLEMFHSNLRPCPPSGFGHVRSQPGDEPGHWRVPLGLVRRQPGGPAGHAHRSVRHLLHPAGRPRVSAQQDEAEHLGGAHLLGAG